MLKLIDTFSGIGGFSLAAEQIVGGFETVAFVECEPYCQKILKKHWPTVPIYDDIRTYKPEPYSTDVICSGFPCQDLSVAGRGEGIKKDTRSGLFYELLRVIRLVRPRFVVLENVSAILTNGLDIVLGELYKAGYDAEWACFPASMVGACHQRDRWWLIAYPNNNGSSATKKSRSVEKTDGGAEERQNEAGKSQGSSQSRNSKTIQLDVANSQSKRLEREDKTRLQREGVWGDTSRCSSSTSNSKSIGMEGMRSSWQQIQPEMEGAGVSKWRFKRDLLSPDWRSYSSQPVLRRGDDGLSNRVDRLRALGNTVVVPCAAIPLQRVLDLHNEQSRNKDPAGNKTCTRKDQEPSSVP